MLIQELLTLLCLLALAISVPIFARGCYQIKSEIPFQGENISNQIEKTSTLLDEMCDMINEFANTAIDSSSQMTQAPTDMLGILTALLKPRTTSHVKHGETQEERQVYEINETNTTQAESELS
jgi:hypothetical protein